MAVRKLDPAVVDARAGVTMKSESDADRSSQTQVGQERGAT
jgi:hypothetical protein